MKSRKNDAAVRVRQLSGLVERAPGDLKPWPDNPRKHSDKQLHKLKASIQNFGFTAPVLVDEGGVILSGHGRALAAHELGLQFIPTRIISGLTRAQKRAYVIADNKLAQLSSWDAALLGSEMEILIKEDFEIETTGFSTAEVDLMFDIPAPGTEDDPDDLQPEDIPLAVVSRPGDLWQLGNHLLLCASALEDRSFQQIMNGQLAQMAITDPPYNVPIDGHVCGSGKVKHREFAMASGEMTPEQFTGFLGQAFRHTSLQLWPVLANVASSNAPVHSRGTGSPPTTYLMATIGVRGADPDTTFPRMVSCPRAWQAPFKMRM